MSQHLELNKMYIRGRGILRPRERKFMSNNSFFDGEIIIFELYDKIIFKKPSSNYNGKVHRFFKTESLKYNGEVFSATLTIDTPIGDYPFDTEESNEDYKVVYLNEKI